MTSPDIELERRIASRLMDVLIRAGLILALALLCYRIFSPFLTLMVWALILAVTLYPLHQMLAARMGGRQGWSATVLTLLGVALIVAPTAVLMSSLGDSVQQLVTDVQNNTLKIPPPRDRVAEWPLVGDKVHALWSKAHSDLPALIQSMQPQIGDIAKSALAFVAGIGVGLLLFVASFIIAGIIMAFGQAGSGASLAIFSRIVGPERGAEFTKLSTGNHPRRRGGRPRRGSHPGHHRRTLPASRRHSLCRRPHGHRPRPRHRPGACTAGHPAGDCLHLDGR